MQRQSDNGRDAAGGRHQSRTDAHPSSVERADQLGHPEDRKRPGDINGRVLHLQRTAGNRATTQAVGGGQARSVGQLRSQVDAPVVQRDPGGSDINFDDLEREFKDAAAKEATLYEKRAIGSREVLANLGEADSPSIGDMILRAAIMGALGFASGWLSQAITLRVAGDVGDALQNGIQSGIDDLAKDIVPAVVGAALEKGQVSRASYFAAIDSALVDLKEAAILSVNATELKTKQDIRAGRLSMSDAIKAIQERRKVIDGFKETARDVQYRESLSQWMVAMAQGELGRKANGGTDVREIPGYGGDPTAFFKRDRPAGVLRLTFGLKSAQRPVRINFGTVEGMNESTLNRMRNTRIRDLRIPVFAQGWIYDGFLDGLGKGDNEVSMARNERGDVHVNFGDDAEDAMLGSSFAKGMTKVVDVAEDILLNDFGNQTLGSIEGL
jgi:hypothetical protein